MQLDLCLVCFSLSVISHFYISIGLIVLTIFYINQPYGISLPDLSTETHRLRGITLWVSANRQPFKQAQIPSTYPHMNYIVDSVKSVQALVIVQHTNNQYNLYMSEEKSFLYILSLADIKVERSNQFFVIDLQIVSTCVQN